MTKKAETTARKAINYALDILCSVEYKRLGNDIGNNRAYALVTLEHAGQAISLLKNAQDALNAAVV